MDDGAHAVPLETAPSRRAGAIRAVDQEVVLSVNDGFTLSGLYVYPIKSCGGVALERTTVSATGLRHDRRWMLVDEAGEFISQRRLPRMASFPSGSAPNV